MNSRVKILKDLYSILRNEFKEQEQVHITYIKNEYIIVTVNNTYFIYEFCKFHNSEVAYSSTVCFTHWINLYDDPILTVYHNNEIVEFPSSHYVISELKKWAEKYVD